MYGQTLCNVLGEHYLENMIMNYHDIMNIIVDIMYE
jgi:hypothetical protein